MAPTGPGIRCHISPLWSKGNSAVYAARALEADDLWGVWQLRCVSPGGRPDIGFPEPNDSCSDPGLGRLRKTSYSSAKTTVSGVL